MGNSLGGLSLYTDLEDKYEAYQGGFIWDYIDQAIETKNDDGKTVLVYGGDFEDRPSDYGFCTNGVIYADRTYSPKVQEMKALYSNIRMSIDLIASFNSLSLDNSATHGLQPVNQKLTTVTASAAFTFPSLLSFSGSSAFLCCFPCSGC